MRILHLSDGWTLLICFFTWPILQLVAALICLNLPDRFFSPDSAFFKSYPSEKGGQIYDTVFRVSRWKHLLPDGGTVFKKHAFQKKKLENYTDDNLRRFLTESARSELSHWLAILPFWVFGFIAPPTVPFIMLGYALLVNIPCIIAQRYNRPRVSRLLKKRQHRRMPLSE